MSDNPPAKKKRKAISLDTKIQILDRLASGEGSTSVGKQFGLSEATIRTIRINEHAIRESVCSGTKLSAKSSSYTRDVAKLQMEKDLVMWIDEMAQNRLSVDGPAIKQTALRIYTEIKEMRPATSQSNKNKFTASTGWMIGFLERHGLHSIRVKCETDSIDFQKVAPKFIIDGGQDGIVGGRGRSRRGKSIRTYILNPQKSADALEAVTDQSTSAICSDAPKLKPPAKKPRSKKDLRPKKLPVCRKAKKRAMVNTGTSTEWSNIEFPPQVETLDHLNEREDAMPFAGNLLLECDTVVSEDEDIEDDWKNLDPKQQRDDNSILNVNFIKEGLALANELGNHFAKHDPNEQRVVKFQQDLKSLVSSCRELYKGLDMAQTQPSLSEFIDKFSVTLAPHNRTDDDIQFTERTLSVNEYDNQSDVSDDTTSSDDSYVAIIHRHLLGESDSE